MIPKQSHDLRVLFLHKICDMKKSMYKSNILQMWAAYLLYDMEHRCSCLLMKILCKQAASLKFAHMPINPSIRRPATLAIWLVKTCTNQCQIYDIIYSERYYLIHTMFLFKIIYTPKGAKVYPASRWRSGKRVRLKGQLDPHCVPWLQNSIMAYKRLSTSLGSKTLNTSSLGLGGTTI